MRRQSQALRLAIKQATNAKPVSQANKPLRSLSRRTLRDSHVAPESKDSPSNMKVAVLDTTKKPLAPTTPRRARLLLKKGKAAVFRRYPFTIILKREIVNPSTPDLKLKVDPGSKTTGVAIVNQESGEVILAVAIERPVIASLASRTEGGQKTGCHHRSKAALRTFTRGRADLTAPTQSKA